MKFRVKRHAVTQPLSESYRLIPLTQNQNAIVDANDFNWLNQWNWCASWNPKTKSFYAMRRHSGQHIKMHRFILNCQGKEEGDHIDKNTLNNRRKNIRRCTHAENSRNIGPTACNPSGKKGVYWSKARGKWESKLEFNGKRIWVGRFTSIEEAANAYDRTAKKYFGEFAHLNSPS